MSTPDEHQDAPMAKKARSSKPERANPKKKNKKIAAAPKATRSRLHAKEEPNKDISPDADVSAIKHEFARRLQNLMTDKGWNQSDLARAASPFIAGGKFNRDNISLYIRATHLPTPKYLRALCKALNVQQEDLLPAAAIRQPVSDPYPPFAMRPLPNGNTWLQINQGLPYELAWKIMGLLAEAGISIKKEPDK